MALEHLASQERPPEIETVRAAILHRGKILLLEKDATSNNPGSLEFPGGKIDEQAGPVSNEEEQRKALLNEIIQETGIQVTDLPIQKLEEFPYYFETGSEENRKKHYRRTHLFLVTLPDTMKASLSVGQTKDEQGTPEDRHSGYRWVTPEELRALALTLEESAMTGKRQKLLARNSRHIQSLLAALEALPTAA